jgi:hypothetical protein
MKLPKKCPSCEHVLHVKSMHCPSCETQVGGDYELPLLALLSKEEQDFIISFVKSSGSLKQMSKELGLSYPTVRNRLDDIIKLLEEKV